MRSNLGPLLRIERLIWWRSLLDSLGKSRWRYLLLPLMGLAVLPFVVIATIFFAGLFYAGQLLGHDQLVLTISLAAGQFASLTFGVVYIISAFYFSEDLRTLLPLPLRPGDILLAKFIRILLSKYLTIAPIVLPGLAVYGVLADVGWTYIPFALATFLFTPALPLALATLLSLLVMRVTNLKGSKELWRALGILVSVGFGIGLQFFARMTGSQFRPSSEAIKQLVESQGETITVVGRLFPTSVWAANALKAGAPAGGIGWFLLFCGAALAVLLVTYWMGERFFLGGLIGGDETQAARQALSRGELMRQTGRAQSPFRALVQREWRLFARTPAYMLSALLPVVVFPLIIIMPMIQDQKTSGMLTLVHRYAGTPLVTVLAVGAFLFMMAMSAVGSSGVSREGRHFWLSRTLPAAPSLQLHAKAAHTVSFSLFYVAVVIAAGWFLGVWSPSTLAYTVAGCLLAAGVSAYGGLLIDVMRPNLTWTDPQRAMKNPKNGLFNLLFLGFSVGGNAVVGLVLYKLAGAMAAPGLLIALALEAFVLSWLAGRTAEQRYATLEE